LAQGSVHHFRPDCNPAGPLAMIRCVATAFLVLGLLSGASGESSANATTTTNAPTLNSTTQVNGTEVGVTAKSTNTSKAPGNTTTEVKGSKVGVSAKSTNTSKAPGTTTTEAKNATASDHHGNGPSKDTTNTTTTTTTAPTTTSPELPPEVAMTEKAMTDTVAAFLEGFFHKSVVTEKTETCFDRTAKGFVSALYVVINKTNEIMAASDAPEGEQAAAAEHLEADVTELMMAAGEAVHQMKSLINKCITEKLQAAFDQVQEHLNDGSYLIDHLECNADCVYINTVDAGKAFEAQHPEAAGKHMGSALRCLLLSKAELPEGPPGPEDTGSVIEGFFTGFFGNNATLTIRKVDDLDEKDDVVLNLSECLSSNMQTWEDAWSEIWVLVSSAASQPELGAAPTTGSAPIPVQGGYEPSESEAESQDPMKQMEDMWNKLTTMILVELPQAMKKCGVSDEQSVMLLDSLGEINTFQTSLQIPGKQDVYATLETLGKAVDEWQNGDYNKFGASMGMFFRGLLVTFLNDKYYVSEVDGSLQMVQQEERGMSLWPVGFACLLVPLASAMIGRRAMRNAGFAVLAGDHPHRDAERAGEQDALTEEADVEAAE